MRQVSKSCLSHFYFMKNLIKILFLFFLLIGFSASSQENLVNDSAILTQNIKDYKLTTTVSQNYSALISQIGNQNWNQNTIIANQSNIQIYQNGEFNTTDIYRIQNEVNELIYQNGTNNSINEMVIGSYNSTNNQFIQNGDNNRITTFGSNSISEDLKIHINGNNTSIIIINR